MSFIWPTMLWLLLLLPLTVLLYAWLLKRRRKNTVRLASLGVAKAALGRGPGWRRHVPPALMFVALAALLFAVSRPTATITLPMAERTIILAMDVSGSMRDRGYATREVVQTLRLYFVPAGGAEAEVVAEQKFTAEELRPLAGADLVRIAVEEGWTSPKPLAALTVTAVEQEVNVATLRVERTGELVPIRLVLRHELGAWKLDLVELARGCDALVAMCQYVHGTKLPPAAARWTESGCLAQPKATIATSGFPGVVPDLETGADLPRRGSEHWDGAWPYPGGNPAIRRRPGAGGPEALRPRLSAGLPWSTRTVSKHPRPSSRDDRYGILSKVPPRQDLCAAKKT